MYFDAAEQRQRVLRNVTPDTLDAIATNAHDHFATALIALLVTRRA